MPSISSSKTSKNLFQKAHYGWHKTIEGPTQAYMRPIRGRLLKTCLGDRQMKKNQGADFRSRPSASTAGTLLLPGETTGMAGNSG
jgi:hypothetical protein